MTKQKEIEQTLKDFIQHAYQSGKQGKFYSVDNHTTALQGALMLRGVVIKVDREPPDMPETYEGEDGAFLYDKAQEDMENEGWEAIVPLIEVKK